MLFTTFKRITRSGFVNFWRNGFLSFAAIVVITLALLTFGAIIFTGAFGRAILTDVKDKVDINVYFSLTADEGEILALQKEVNNLPQVASTTYVSRDQALQSFKKRWQNNTLIMQGLEEVGSNPFPASLNIKSKDPGQYGNIANYLEDRGPKDSNGAPIIEKINYEENKLIIDRLGRIIPTAERAGAIVAFIMALVAVIVVWNTIRLIIFTERDEISVMKLVGASNIFVRGPLVVSGIMYGLFSAIITLLIMAVLARWIDVFVIRLAGVQVAADFATLVNVSWNYFVSNFTQIFLIIVGAGIILGGLSSYIAARRYLKI